MNIIPYAVIGIMGARERLTPESPLLYSLTDPHRLQPIVASRERHVCECYVCGVFERACSFR